MLYMQPTLFLDSLQRAPRRAFDVLSEQKWIREDGWYLAGSAAWSLQLGHRKSDDLEFFVDADAFDTEKLLANLKKCRFNIDNNEDEFEAGMSINAHYRGASVRFSANSHLMPTHEKVLIQNIPLIHADDLAVMTLLEMGEQPHKHHLVDLCWYLKTYSVNLEAFLKTAATRYETMADQLALGIESLTDFDDVEDEPMPRMSVKLSWDSVQSFFINQTTFHNHTPESH